VSPPPASMRKPGGDALIARLDARFRGPLMVFFLRRKFSRSEAEDLTQEVFARMIGRDAERRLSKGAALALAAAAAASAPSRLGALRVLARAALQIPTGRHN